MTITAFLSCSIPSAFSSNPERSDSLLRVINTLTDNQEKADQLIQLSLAFYSLNNLDSSEKYCQQALLISEQLSYLQGMEDCYFRLSLIRNRQTEYNDAIHLVVRAIALSESFNDTNRMVRGYHTYAEILSTLGKKDSALHYYREGDKMNRVVGNTQRMIAINNGMGNVFQDISKFDSAIFYYLKAVRLCEEHDYPQYLGLIYNNLGKSLSQINEDEDALKYLELSLEINTRNNNNQQMALNLINIGAVYLRKDEDSKALSYFEQAMVLLQDGKALNTLADLHHTFGVIYLRQGQFDLALANFRKALGYYSYWNYPEGMAIALLNIGKVYIGQGRYAAAQIVLDSSLSIAKESGYLKNQRDIYLYLSKNSYSAGDYKKAHDYRVMQNILNDSIFNLESTRMINDLKLAYEREQDQTQILTLQNINLEMALNLQRQTSQRNATLFTGIGIVALSLFLLLYFRQLSRKDKIIAKQKIQQLEEEKKLLAARVLVEGQEKERKRIARELHDGLGVLLSATKMQFTTIKDKSPENRPMIEKATQLLEQASSDVRKISHNMMPGLLTKLGLYEATADLIERINETENINARFRISGDKSRLPENKEIMLYRIVQELVNNTLKHARASKIELTIETNPGTLLMHYMDNGVGYDVQKLLDVETGSFGLRSLQSRVGFLNGTMDIKSSPGQGVRFFIEVPV
ncbi:MAG: sensor histidine kinase [Bacteroidales bacterium]|nr:sensor histidine kinase [Bacteroidales bacterium]